MRKFSVLFIVIMLVVEGSQAIGDDLLEKLSGAWIGKGWAKPSADAPVEPVRCKVTNTYNRERQKVTVSGMCAVPGQRFEMAGSFEFDRVLEIYRGSWLNPFTNSLEIVQSRGTGSRVVFEIKPGDLDFGVPLLTTMTWTVSDSGYAIETSGQETEDGFPIDFSSIKFTR